MTLSVEERKAKILEVNRKYYRLSLEYFVNSVKTCGMCGSTDLRNIQNNSRFHRCNSCLTTVDFASDMVGSIISDKGLWATVNIPYVDDDDLQEPIIKIYTSDTNQIFQTDTVLNDKDLFEIFDKAIGNYSLT